MKLALTALVVGLAATSVMSGTVRADDDWDDIRDARREYFERQRRAEREYWEDRREAEREYREEVRDWYRDRWDDGPRFRAYRGYYRPYGYYQPYGYYGYDGYPGYYQPYGAYFHFGW